MQKYMKPDSFDMLIKKIEEKKLMIGESAIDYEQIKEIIKAEKSFGVCVDEKTGEPICSTNEAVIHYSKKRTHIVPKRKDDAK